MLRLIPPSIRRFIYEYRLRLRFPLAVIHNGSTADQTSKLGEWAVLFSNVHLVDSSLGRFSYVQQNTSVYNTDIGPFCSVASSVTIGLINHPTFMVSTSPVFYDPTQPLPRFMIRKDVHTRQKSRTVIEADVWIGEGVRILSGVKIGTGAVIGAGSVVTRDIAPYTIAAGVPCRPLKQRFSDDICKRLLESAWWTIDEQSLVDMAITYSDPIAFLNEIEKTACSSKS